MSDEEIYIRKPDTRKLFHTGTTQNKKKKKEEEEKFVQVFTSPNISEHKAIPGINGMKLYSVLSNQLEPLDAIRLYGSNIS